jgi:hypothetical protein
MILAHTPHLRAQLNSSRTSNHFYWNSDKPIGIYPHTSHTKQKIPATYLFFDTEAAINYVTDTKQEQTLKVGCALFWRRYKNREDTVKRFTFYTSKEFYDIVNKASKNSSNLIVLAHNLDYDFQLSDIKTELENNLWKCTRFQLSQTSILFQFKDDNKHKITFLDNQNIFKGSLDNIGKKLGVEKYNVDFETCSLEDLTKHCQQDVEILFILWQKWIEFLIKHNLGSVKYTLPSQALESYKQKFLKKVVIRTPNKEVRNLERESYYGGRVECHYIGVKEEPLYLLDVNSMYPSVMKGKQYPINYKGFLSYPTISKALNLMDTYFCFAKVNITTDKPYFPQRSERGLLFPIGSFTTTLAHPELKLAMDLEVVDSINYIAYYEQNYLFDDYVTYFYGNRIRAEEINDTASSSLFKLFLNSLYGKFAERSKVFIKIGDSPYLDDCEEWHAYPSSNQYYKVIHFNGTMFQLTNGEDKTHSMPLIASAVTSYARVKLLNLMRFCGWNNWLYCDTDSLIVTKRGYDLLRPMIHNTKLGYLKLIKEIPHITINGLKDYETPYERKIKGVNRDSREVDKNIYEVLFFSRIAKAIKNNTWGIVTVERKNKELKREYKKGVVLHNGWVEPIELSEYG